MAKSKKTYEKEILEIIEKHNVFSVLDVFAFYKGCSRATFYNQDLDKLDSIKRALENNKIITKHSLKSKWAKSDNATLQLALFKTICTEEERDALAMQKIDHTSKGDKINIPISKWTNEDE
jgi:hypothetical protein